MTNALLSYQFDDTPVRIVMVAGDPWFVANDVAKALGYREAYDMCRNLDDDERGAHNVSTLGGDQSVNIISESGLYAAVLKSRKEEAKRFRKWVTGEVLPSLRKTGQYLMHDIEPAPMQSIDFDPSRLAVGVSVIREARRLWGPVAARNLWAQVGLPPCVLDSEAVFDGDPIAMPLKAYLTGKVETTIQQAAEGMGIDNLDMSTRFRIGKLLAMWGWVAKNRKVSKHRTARIFSRPAASVIVDQPEA
jgi:hypothetical protein